MAQTQPTYRPRPRYNPMVRLYGEEVPEEMQPRPAYPQPRATPPDEEVRTRTSGAPVGGTFARILASLRGETDEPHVLTPPFPSPSTARVPVYRAKTDTPIGVSQAEAASPRRVPSYSAVQNPADVAPAQVDGSSRPTATLDEIAAAGGENTPTTTATAQPEPVVSLDRASKIMDRIEKLEADPAKDKNGRLKSFFIGLLHSMSEAARQQIESGNMSLGAVLGAGLGGGVGGAVYSDFDEKLKKRAEIERERGRLKEAISFEELRATIAKHQPSPDTVEAKQHKREMAELSARLRVMGGTYTPGKDKVLDELVGRLGTAPKRGGSGFNAQRVKSVRGADGVDRLVYVESPDSAYVINIDGSMGEALSERDRRNLAVDLARENRQRGQDGLPPLDFSGDLPSAPPAQAPLPQAAPLPSQTPSLAPVAAPAPRRSSDLVPVPGAKADPSLRRPVYHGRRRPSYGRGGGGGGSRGGDSVGQSITNNRMLGLVGEFETAKRRGDLDAARGIANEIRSNPNTARDYEVGEDTQGNPYVKRRVPRAHADRNRQSGPGPISSNTITRGQLKLYAQTYGMSVRGALAAAKEEGYRIAA